MQVKSSEWGRKKIIITIKALTRSFLTTCKDPIGFGRQSENEKERFVLTFYSFYQWGFLATIKKTINYI